MHGSFFDAKVSTIEKELKSEYALLYFRISLISETMYNMVHPVCNKIWQKSKSKLILICLMILQKGYQVLTKNGDFFLLHQFWPHFEAKFQKWPYLGNGWTDLKNFWDQSSSNLCGPMVIKWAQNSDQYGPLSIESFI